MKPRVLLAFSGGPDSTAAVGWLIERHAVDVVTVTLDVGQGPGLDGVRARALAAGAIRAHVLDQRATFAGEIVWPILAAAVDPEPDPFTLAAPLIAHSLVQVARLERVGAVAHGAGGRAAGRLETLVASLAPGLAVIPALVRQDASAHDGRGGPAAGGLASAPPSLQVDSTLWGRQVTGAAVAEPWPEAPEGAFAITRPPAACPDTPALVDLTLDGGKPVEVNGIAMGFLELIESVGTIAGVHGVGRSDAVTVDARGRVTRAVREAPAAAVLRLAHRELEALTMSPAERAFRGQVAAQYAALLDEGRWFLPLRSALDAYVGVVQARVSGTIRVSLFKGDCRGVARRAAQQDPKQPAVATAG